MTIVPLAAERTPSEFVDAQVQVLNLIYQAQLKQQAVLEKIRFQQEQMAGSPLGSNVKIVDFNMPFFALVGILVKIAVASIPAAIILGILSAVIAVLLTIGLSALGIGLSALGGR